MNDSNEKTDVPSTPTGGTNPSTAASSPSESPSSKPNFKALIGSILAAAIGVQSNKNREKDFSQRSIWPFVIGGIVFTILFIVSLILIATTAINA